LRRRTFDKEAGTAETLQDDRVTSICQINRGGFAPAGRTS
jgi:hypothetical protein